MNRDNVYKLCERIIEKGNGYYISEVMLSKEAVDAIIDCALLSSHKEVRDELKRRGIRFIAVCPKMDCLSIYLARYLKRGSSYEFMLDIIQNWYEYIHDMMNEDVVIQLEGGQYLKDILPLF